MSTNPSLSQHQQIALWARSYLDNPTQENREALDAELRAAGYEPADFVVPNMPADDPMFTSGEIIIVHPIKPTQPREET
jgi:hypothetical protein